MATGDVPRLVDQLPAPSKALSGDVTVGDQCLVLHHPNQQGLLEDLRKLAKSVAGERTSSEGYDSATGTYDYDLETIPRKDSLDSCFSSYNSGDLADVSRKLAFGFGAAGVRCTVECEESLEQRYETVESFSVAEYSESDSDSEDGGERCEWALAEDRGDDGEEQPTDEVIQSLSSVLHREANQRFESLCVSDSEAVHVGNVTYILGEVNVKQVVQETSLKQQVFVSHDKAEFIPLTVLELQQQTNPAQQEDYIPSWVHQQALALEARQQQQRQASLEGHILPPYPLRIVDRNEWLAQPPSQPAVPARPPLNLILINHTATEASTKLMTNMMLCRRIQLMHMEGNEWWDIAYNFLVGMDGYIYEARGWGVVGAHTYGYNSRSLGVAFIGCFMQHVPTPQAVAAFHQLVELGVSQGHLTPDCRVMGQCQVAPSESPGRAFFLQMKTWPRWAETPPPPPPLHDSATKQRECVGTASAATNDSSHAERECTAEKQDMSADCHGGSDGTLCPLTPAYKFHTNDHTIDTTLNIIEFHHPETIDKSEDGWEGPDEQRVVVCPEPIAHSLDQMGAQTVSSQSVMLREGVQRAESSGYGEQTLTERSSESREAVTVSSSRDVHLGSVNYVLGPMCVSHVVQRSTVERTITVTRPDAGGELCLVQRNEWGAQPAKKDIRPLPRSISLVVLCHTETNCGATLQQEARHVAQLQEYAQSIDALPDIRYNFVVGATGYVFEGRGWRLKCAFACGYDDNTLAVAFIGNFKAQPPTPEALDAFQRLMAVGEREGHLGADWRAMGLCQLVVTDSPGHALYQLLRSWPRWAGPTAAETADLQELELVSRQQWLASPSAETIPKLESPVRIVVICHTETKEPTSVEGERRQVRSLQDFEVHCRGRADLPFHFLVAPSGVVYEGRGWQLAADLSPGLGLEGESHAPGGAGGGRCLAVALLGSFRRHLPAPAALDALQYLVAEAQRRGVLARDYHIVGHRQLADTASPGEALFSLLKTWPRWTDRPFDSGTRDSDESDTAPVR